MKDLLTDIESFLKAEQLDEGVAIFKDSMQEKPDFAICLYEYGGSTPLPQIQGATRPVQIVVRSAKVSEAKTRINAIYNTLCTEDGIISFTPERWAMIAIQQPPFRMKVDDKGRVYYCFNVVTTTYID